jgi:hypothetical protein
MTSRNDLTMIGTYTKLALLFFFKNWPRCTAHIFLMDTINKMALT